jgi:hypothetical protein
MQQSLSVDLLTWNLDWTQTQSIKGAKASGQPKQSN